MGPGGRDPRRHLGLGLGLPTVGGGRRGRQDPCDVVAARWIKSIHDALVPVNSVRRDMGGGREWARTWDRKNLTKMAKELRFVIGLYQQWLTEIEEVVNETAE